jgi:hypothetical protein
MTATAAGIYANSWPPTGQGLAWTTPTGSFKFYIYTVTAPSENLAPRILNYGTDPRVVTIGESITFYAEIVDPDAGVENHSTGIDKALVCKKVKNNGFCENKYCEMQNVDGIYKCSITIDQSFVDSNCQEGVCSYDMFANDTLSAWNTTSGAHGVNNTIIITTKYVAIDINYPDTPYPVPIINNKPSFTRGMSIKFLASALIKDKENKYYEKLCDDKSCIVEYGINGVLKNATWSPFDKAWSGSMPSSSLDCDSTYKLAIKAKVKPDGPAHTELSDFYINCTPKVVLSPRERRLTLGATNQKIFDVTIFNPKDAANFNIAMRSISSMSPLGWIRFDCDNCDDSATLNVPALSSNTISVIGDASRSGVYEISFDATSSGQTYSERGTLSVFSEGLPEFGIIQLIGLIIIAGIVFAIKI